MNDVKVMFFNFYDQNKTSSYVQSQQAVLRAGGRQLRYTLA